jgi:hypothetical protein
MKAEREIFGHEFIAWPLCGECYVHPDTKDTLCTDFQKYLLRLKAENAEAANERPC